LQLGSVDALRRFFDGFQINEGLDTEGDTLVTVVEMNEEPGAILGCALALAPMVTDHDATRRALKALCDDDEKDLPLRAAALVLLATAGGLPPAGFEHVGTPHQRAMAEPRSPAEHLARLADEMVIMITAWGTLLGLVKAD
jgi:hypothetical protein